MDSLLAKLSEQQVILREQNEKKKKAEAVAAYARAMEKHQAYNNLPITSGIDNMHVPSTMARLSPNGTLTASGDEVLRLKLELAQAHHKINRLDKELTTNRTTSQSDASQILSVAATDPDYPTPGGTGQITPIGMAPTQTVRSLYNRENNIWAPPDGNRQDTMDGSSNGSIGRTRNLWRADIQQPGLHQSFPTAPGPVPHSHSPYVTQPTSVWPPPRGTIASFMEASVNQSFGDNSTPMDDGRSEYMAADSDMILRPPSQLPDARMESHIHNGPAFSSYNTFGAGHIQYGNNGTYPPGPGATSAALAMYPQYLTPQPPIGTPLSPHASEFNEVSLFITRFPYYQV